jgi:hypothetical protein
MKKIVALVVCVAALAVPVVASACLTAPPPPGKLPPGIVRI